MSEDALKLPWTIQLALASGYAAYLICFVGIRRGHKTVDTTFSTLVFGLVATATLWVLRSWQDPLVEGVIAFGITLAVGLIWRRFGRKVLESLIRAADISWANNDASAIETLAADSTHRVTQVAVLTDDGTWLRCDDARRFAGAPFAPYVLGQDGDIALYITHEEQAGVEAKELQTVRDPVYGDRVTWIPASRVRRLNIRYAPAINRPSKGVVAALVTCLVHFLAGQKSQASSDSGSSAAPQARHPWSRFQSRVAQFLARLPR